MIRQRIHRLKRASGKVGRWGLLCLALLALLSMPVLHAQHVHASIPLIPADLHGELCLAWPGDGNSFPDGNGHGLMVCECLACKLLSPAAGPAAGLQVPVVAGPVVARLRGADVVHPAPACTRPPSQGPPVL